MRPAVFALLAACLGCAQIVFADNSASTNDAQLTGLWSTGCWNGDGTNLSFRNDATFDGAQYSLVAQTFVEPSCASPVFTTEERGSYSTGDAVQGPEGARALDVVLRASFLTLQAQEYVDYYNEHAYCGFRDWQLGVAKDITGLTCGANQYPAAGSRFYDFYAFNTVDGELRMATGYYDEDHDGSSPEARPVEIGTVYGRL
jgi:hypothetical protein